LGLESIQSEGIKVYIYNTGKKEPARIIGITKLHKGLKGLIKDRETKFRGLQQVILSKILEEKVDRVLVIIVTGRGKSLL
jgi:superfamily II DNA helicase RecQ